MRFALACGLVALGVALSGCGGKKASSNGEASLSATRIAADAKAALKSAKTVHLVGSGTSGGTRLSLDLQFVNGQGGSGHITESGLGFDIVHVGGKTYFKGDANFLKHYAGSEAAKLLAGKWFYVASSVPGFGSLGALTNLTQLTNAIFSTTGTLTKGAAATVDGQAAIAIRDKSDGGTLYVATTGPAYPIEIKPGGGSGVIRFEDWGKAVTLAAPKNPLDYAKLVGKG